MFILGLSSGIWLDGASITPGAIGIAAAQAPFQASFHFDPQIYREPNHHFAYQK
jgi:hypothetical protein